MMGLQAHNSSFTYCFDSILFYFWFFNFMRLWDPNLEVYFWFFPSLFYLVCSFFCSLLGLFPLHLLQPVGFKGFWVLVSSCCFVIWLFAWELSLLSLYLVLLHYLFTNNKTYMKFLLSSLCIKLKKIEMIMIALRLTVVLLQIVCIVVENKICNCYTVSCVSFSVGQQMLSIRYSGFLYAPRDLILWDFLAVRYYIETCDIIKFIEIFRKKSESENLCSTDRIQHYKAFILSIICWAICSVKIYEL